MTMNVNTAAIIDALEEKLFAFAQSFMSRLEDVTSRPVINEAGILSVKAALDKLTNDMQAFSNSLILEGPSSGILLSGTPLGTAFGITEGNRSAAA